MSNVTPLQKADKDLEKARDYVLMGAAVFSGLALSLAIKNHFDIKILLSATNTLYDTVETLIDSK